MAVLVAGASGLVGQALLADLLGDTSVRAVHCLVRRPLGLRHDKLIEHLIELAAPTPSPLVLPPLAVAYIALGTTIAQAGSQAAFRAVDHDAVLRAAQLAWAAGARRLALVSALGADPESRVFYNRVKGEAEASLRGMAWDRLVLARPSLLQGDRAALGQAGRRGEGLALRLAAALRPILPRHVRAIAATDVARGMQRALRPPARGTEVLLSAALRDLARASRALDQPQPA